MSMFTQVVIMVLLVALVYATWKLAMVQGANLLMRKEGTNGEATNIFSGLRDILSKSETVIVDSPPVSPSTKETKKAEPKKA